MTVLKTELGENSYPIIIGNGLLEQAGEHFNFNRKAIIVTDSGVPREYAECVRIQCKNAEIITVSEGEGSKSMAVLEALLSKMCELEMDRGDCAIAVGGGVVGDLTGFAASLYMRGIDFYNIPTTLLSQVDSSIGGKTAINFNGIKNIVGSFKQPKGVLIDTDTLKTLPDRQFSNGLAESIKMSLTSDKKLFEDFCKMSLDEIRCNISNIIERSLKIKKSVVEKDEKESGLRRILNFGHTFGHAIEADEGMHGLYHGECVALGMLPMTSPDVRKRLTEVLKKVGLPYRYEGDKHSALKYTVHDKKCKNGRISTVKVLEAGSFIMDDVAISDFEKMILNIDF